MAPGKQRCQIIFLLGVFAFPKGFADGPQADAANTIAVDAHRTQLSYAAAPHHADDGTIYVLEKTEYSDGSKLTRHVAAWTTKTKYPIEVLLLEDFQLPTRTAPERDAHNRLDVNPFEMRPTTTLVPLTQLSDAAYVDSLNSECYEDELTAVARIRADSIVHRALHNSVAAQSGHGRSPFFALGYVVCVKSDEKSEPAAAPAKD